jgi:hypothetical protein
LSLVVPQKYETINEKLIIVKEQLFFASIFPINSTQQKNVKTQLWNDLPSFF